MTTRDQGIPWRTMQGERGNVTVIFRVQSWHRLYMKRRMEIKKKHKHERTFNDKLSTTFWLSAKEKKKKQTKHTKNTTTRKRDMLTSWFFLSSRTYTVGAVSKKEARFHQLKRGGCGGGETGRIKKDRSLHRDTFISPIRDGKGNVGG